MKRGRSRELRFDDWEQNIAKARRNKGLEYVSYSTKKTVSARKVGEPCGDGCFTKVGIEAVDDIFHSYWDIGAYDARLSYLNSCVRETSFKRKYTKKQVSKRPMKIVYSVRHSGMLTEVCKKGFLSIHGMRPKEIQVFLAKRKQSLTGPITKDMRGKHPSAHKIGGVKLQRVHEHILSIPVTSSHYSHVKNPHRQYTEENLDISTLYLRYITWMKAEHGGEAIVYMSFYRRIFTTCYNIAFQPPKTDVCNLCSSLDLSIKELKGIPEKLSAVSDLEDEKHMHLSAANEAQTLLRNQQFDTDPDLMVIAVDLQQTLPCPRLFVNRAYYTRKLWVYNLCVYDVKKKVGNMFVWDESTGGEEHKNKKIIPTIIILVFFFCDKLKNL